MINCTDEAIYDGLRAYASDPGGDAEFCTYADDDGRLVSFAPPTEVRRLAMEIAQVFFDAAQRAQEEAQRQATLNALKAAGIHIPGME